MPQQTLCGIDACRRLTGHEGAHDPFPEELWEYFEPADKGKLIKAGFATPRGGARNAYQNHVLRSNQVIIPYERVAEVDLEQYKDGFVIRFHPEQYFDGPGIPKAEFTIEGAAISVGRNAFVLYRTHESLRDLPPLDGWKPRNMVHNGEEITRRRADGKDQGEYVLRIARKGKLVERLEGIPQGIFAPEYAERNTNYLCRCVLAWLIIQTQGSPYTLMQAQASHLRLVLTSEGLDSTEACEIKGILRHGLTSCPLCLRFIRYNELHDSVDFEEALGLGNAGIQVEGATRSTIVNLFHLRPLYYNPLEHIPTNVAWGHAICNTRLGQRRCYSLSELIAAELKVGIIKPEGIETFGWISEDLQMIRSPEGAVWIQINGNTAEGPPMAEPADPDIVE